jgi:hypothetical protein
MRKKEYNSKNLAKNIISKINKIISKKNSRRKNQNLSMKKKWI